MLHNLLSHYLEEVEAAVRKLKNFYIELYSEEILTPRRINLRIRVRFVSGHLLELNEAAMIERGKINHLSYRYHLQEKQNKLVFRYDNAPHFPALDSFPHHKHFPDRVAPNSKISIVNAIREADLIANRESEMDGAR